jgi:hypothetical protein
VRATGRTLTHCTLGPGRGTRAAIIALASFALASGALAPPSAHADGDPASDVLAQQSVFLPQDAGLNASRQLALDRLVQDAARASYPVKVAVIASPADLGSVTELWNQPQLYARFLGQELSLLGRTRLVVVMPAGVGVTATGPSTPAQRKPPPAVADLRQTSQADLGTVAGTAVQRLAAAAGIHLSTPVIVPAAAPAASSPIPWIVLSAGAVLIAVAWVLSLRARPPAWWRSAARAAEPPAAR